MLKACQQIRFQCRIGKDEQLSQSLLLLILQAANITAQGMYVLAVFHIALQGKTVIPCLCIRGEVIMTQKILQNSTFFRLYPAQQGVGSFVVQDQVVIIVEQDDALADIPLVSAAFSASAG